MEHSSSITLKRNKKSLELSIEECDKFLALNAPGGYQYPVDTDKNIEVDVNLELLHYLATVANEETLREEFNTTSLERKQNLMQLANKLGYIYKESLFKAMATYLLSTESNHNLADLKKIKENWKRCQFEDEYWQVQRIFRKISWKEIASLCLKKKLKITLKESLSQVLFHPTRNLILTSSRSNIRVWNTQCLQQNRFKKPALKLKTRGFINVLSINSDGSKLVCAGPSGEVNLWKIVGPLEKWCLDKNLTLLGNERDPNVRWRGWVDNLEFSPNGTKIACGCSHDRVVMWEMKKNEAISFACSRGIAVGFDKTGNTLALSDNKEIKFFNIATRVLLYSLSHSTGITSFSFHPTENILVSGDCRGNIYVWDLTTKSYQPFFYQESGISSLKFNSHGDLLAARAMDGKFFIWKFKKNKLILKKDLTQVPAVASEAKGICWKGNQVAVIGDKKFFISTIADKALKQSYYSLSFPLQLMVYYNIKGLLKKRVMKENWKEMYDALPVLFKNLLENIKT